MFHASAVDRSEQKQKVGIENVNKAVMQTKLRLQFDTSDENASHLKFAVQKHYIGVFA